MSLGETHRAEIVLHHLGSESLSISGVESSSDQLTTDAVSGVLLSAGGSMRIVMTFRASEPGPVDVALAIETDGGQNIVNVRGQVKDAPADDPCDEIEFSTAIDIFSATNGVVDRDPSIATNGQGFGWWYLSLAIQWEGSSVQTRLAVHLFIGRWRKLGHAGAIVLNVRDGH